MSEGPSGLRATIIDTGSPGIRSVAIRMDAPAQRDLRPDRATGHASGDRWLGNRARTGDGPGAAFLGEARHADADRLPYVVRNEVVEFEDSRTIAWRHLNHHVWRSGLEAQDADTTLVTETFDGTTARCRPACG
jgi:hypothetical protein